MSEPIDVGILELLASKVCHDLISPIGAVNNGIEILEEMGPSAGQDVVDLIAFSAAQASAKLQVYRMAYGAGGADASLKPEDVYKAVESVIGMEKKIVQEWDPYGPLGPTEFPKGFCKMLVSAFLFAMECLPKGGRILVNAGDNKSTVITAEGENAGLRSGMDEALNLSMKREALEPKFVHPYITGLLAREYGYGISVAETGTGFVKIELTPP